MSTKYEEALVLAEQLLADIELKHIDSMDIARRALRLARLTMDTAAIAWLYYEVAGYPTPEEGSLDVAALAAAKRSNRIYTRDGKIYTHRQGLGELQIGLESAARQIESAADAPVSISYANPNQYASIPPKNTLERTGLRNSMVFNRSLIDKIMGSIHIYVSLKYEELRFGAAVETSFDRLRAQVDSQIASLVPQALPHLTTALENAESNNPVQWSNAAKACRDLVIATADALQPPSKPIKGRPMTKQHYANRLVHWIEEHRSSRTYTDMVVSDLEYFGKRLDAVDDSGHKGAHAVVNKEEASRYIVGAYLLLGDILALNSAEGPAIAAEEEQPTTEPGGN